MLIGHAGAAGRSPFVVPGNMMEIRMMPEWTLAYIDPAAGSVLLQVLVGSMIGASLFFRRTIARMFGLFRRE